MNQADIHYWLHESPDAKREAAIAADEHRDELIAEKREELIAQRKAALCNDDIQAAMESCNKKMAHLIRDAIQSEDARLSLAIMKSMVDDWIHADSEVEAIKWMERTESDDHPARH